MKLRAIRVSAAILCAVLAFASSAWADNRQLAESLRAKLLQLPGFEAVYEGKNNATGATLRIEVKFASPDRVRMDVVSKNVRTVYDGKRLIHFDEKSGTVLEMSLENARRVVKESAKSLATLDWLVSGAKSWPDQADVFPFVLLDLTESNAELAVYFGARACDAPWLNRLAANPDEPEIGDSEIVVSYGEFTHRIDPKTGVLVAVEHRENDVVVRSLTRTSFEVKKPDPAVFHLTLPPVTRTEQAQSDSNAVDAVVRSQFNLRIDALLAASAARWKSTTPEDKQKISAAVTEYWRIAFAANEDLKNRLFKLIDSDQSVALIREQLDDAEAKKTWVAEQKVEGNPAIEELWRNNVSVTLTQEILREAAEPYRREIFESVIKSVRASAKAHKLSEDEANDLLQRHTEGIVLALVEALMAPIRTHVDAAVAKAAKLKP
ncbi:MAG: hypothetical protein IT350_18645 [Deltaproteobacteria bacterium]|nr:hypothetical protein [Deltaproteobacteria bacterium]